MTSMRMKYLFYCCKINESEMSQKKKKKTDQEPKSDNP